MFVIIAATNIKCQVYKCQIYKCQVYKCQVYKCQVYKCQVYKCQVYKCQVYKCQVYKCQVYKCQAYKCQAYKCQAYKCQVYKCQVYKCQVNDRVRLKNGASTVSYKMVNRDTSLNARTIDASVGNKWKWDWLLVRDKGPHKGFLSDYILKMDLAGYAYCTHCDNQISYASGANGNCKTMQKKPKPPKHKGH